MSVQLCLAVARKLHCAQVHSEPSSDCHCPSRRALAETLSTRTRLKCIFPTTLAQSEPPAAAAFGREFCQFGADAVVLWSRCDRCTVSSPLLCSCLTTWHLWGRRWRGRPGEGSRKVLHPQSPVSPSSSPPLSRAGQATTTARAPCAFTNFAP